MIKKLVALCNDNPLKSSFFFGLLFTLAFSPFYVLPFSVIFIYLVMRIDKSETYKQAFLAGFLFYFAHNLTMIPWLTNVSKFVSVLLYPGYILAAMAVGAFYGVAAIITKKIGLRYLPLVFVFIEYLRQFGVLKFPWELSGYMFGFNNYFIQSADLFGVFGLSFMFYTFALLVYSGIKYKNKFFYNIAAGMFIINFIYGYSTYEKPRDVIAEKNVAVLQTNIAQDIKWKSEFRDSTYIIHQNLVNKVATDSTDLIVWAETAAPTYIEKKRADRNRVKNIVKSSNTYNYLGSIRYFKDMTEKRGYRYYNSMFMFDKYGKIIDTYDKSVLVQFGEYVPFGELFPFLKNLDFGQSNFSAGENRNIIEVDEMTLSTFICFEVLFPNYVRKQVAKGSNLIVTTSNDAWFEFMEPEQHFEMARFRAVENRRYLVRSGNIGISGIVTESGKVLKSIDVKKRDAVMAKVKLLGSRTFYSKHGDWIVYFSIIGIILRLFIVVRKKEKIH